MALKQQLWEMHEQLEKLIPELEIRINQATDEEERSLDEEMIKPALKAAKKLKKRIEPLL